MNKTVLLGIVAGIITMGILAAISIANQSAEAAAMSRHFVAQKTAVSDKDLLPGHESHQLVLVLPPRDDGRVWVGTVTWTSSKPVEMVVLHGYDTSVQTGDHGTPLTAPFGNGQVAITLMKEDSGTPVPSGTENFAGTALAFHTLNGDKFTVTYTVSAIAWDLNQ